MRTSDSKEPDDNETGGWSREFWIAQIVTVAVIVVTIALAALSEDRGLAGNSVEEQAYADPGIGFGSGLSGGGPPIECPDTGGLADDCSILLSIQAELAGEAELGWSDDAPVSEWRGVSVAGDSPRVFALNLTTSELYGSIPGELGDLSELRFLHLYGNDLSGEIPPELGRLAYLDTLDLGDNRLTGAIPPELGRLDRLVSLDLSANRLTGAFPAELGDLEKLEWLVVSENDLTGSVETILEGMPNLEYVSVYGNRFSGCIPSRHREIDGFLGDIPFCDAR